MCFNWKRHDLIIGVQVSATVQDGGHEGNGRGQTLVWPLCGCQGDEARPHAHDVRRQGEPRSHVTILIRS